MNTAAVDCTALVQSWKNNATDNANMSYKSQNVDTMLFWARKITAEGITLGGLLQQRKEVRRQLGDAVHNCIRPFNIFPLDDAGKNLVKLEQDLTKKTRYLISRANFDDFFSRIEPHVKFFTMQEEAESVRLSAFVLDCCASHDEAARRGIFAKYTRPAYLDAPADDVEARYARYEQYIADIDALCARADREFGWTADLIEQFMDLIKTAKADKMHMEFGKYGNYFDQANRHAADIVALTVNSFAEAI